MGGGRQYHSRSLARKCGMTIEAGGKSKAKTTSYRIQKGSCYQIILLSILISCIYSYESLFPRTWHLCLILTMHQSLRYAYHTFIILLLRVSVFNRSPNWPIRSVDYFNVHFSSWDKATIFWFKWRKCGVLGSAFFSLACCSLHWHGTFCSRKMKAACIFDFAVLSRDLDLSLSSLLP